VTLIFALAEASLELVPREIWKHPAVKRNAEKRGKKPGETLLDISLHYAAMKGLQGWEKRGRPDIVHTTLLYLLGTPLCRRGLMRIYVHTVNDLVVEIKPETRLPKNYPRFVGLMEQLLKAGRVPEEGEPLIRVIGSGFKLIIDEAKPSYTVLLTEKGRLVCPREVAGLLIKHEKPLVIVGGFHRGDFSHYLYSFANETVSLYPEPLEAWIVSSILLHAYEEALGLYQT